MGGRRARPSSHVLGTRAGIRAFNNTVESGADAQAIAERGAKTLAGSSRLTEVLHYLSQLAEPVSAAAESGRINTPDERVAFANRTWSAFKQREDIPDDPVTTRAVVDAVTKALERGRR